MSLSVNLKKGHHEKIWEGVKVIPGWGIILSIEEKNRGSFQVIMQEYDKKNDVHNDGREAMIRVPQGLKVANTDECIVERPRSKSGFFPLARFSSVHWTLCTKEGLDQFGGVNEYTVSTPYGSAQGFSGDFEGKVPVKRFTMKRGRTVLAHTSAGQGLNGSTASWRHR